jgi:hypothetical protein
MIRTTLTPATTKVFLTIPNDYIGKKVEVLLYILEEVEAVPSDVTTKKKPSDYAGSLSPEAANKILSYIEKSRNEWERGI